MLRSLMPLKKRIISIASRQPAGGIGDPSVGVLEICENIFSQEV